MTEHERLFTILRAHMPDRHAEDAVNELIAAGWTPPASQQAAYAKGLEDAAAELERRSGNIDGSPIKSGAYRQAAAIVRALSPLPPGSRVVVVPPEGSPEWYALVEVTARRRFEANVREAVASDPDEFAHKWVAISEAARAGWRRHIVGALLALTGGDDRD